SLLCTRVVALCPPILVIRGVDESAVLPAYVHPDNAGLPVVSDTVNDPREVVSDVDSNGVVGHPAPTGVIRVIAVPLRVDIRVLRLKERLVIDGTESKLRRPPDVAGDDTDTDEIADIEDVLRRQLLPDSGIQDRPELPVKSLQRLRSGSRTTKRSDRVPGRSNLRVAKPRMRQSRNKVGVHQPGNRINPTFPAVLDNYVHLNVIRWRQHREPIGPLEIETNTDTEHGRLHEESERLGGVIRRHIPRRHERAVRRVDAGCQGEPLEPIDHCAQNLRCNVQRSNTLNGPQSSSLRQLDSVEWGASLTEVGFVVQHVVSDNLKTT